MLHWVFSALQGLFSSCGMGATLPCDAQAFLVVKHWVLWAMDSGVVEHDLSCFSTSGIFLDQGLNLCSLHWQADSYLPHHQGSPKELLLTFIDRHVYWQQMPSISKKLYCSFTSSAKHSRLVGFFLSTP